MNLRRKQSQGVSLIELMIAMTLGAIVTAGIIQLFVSNNETYNILIGQSRLQESSRFAMQFIGRAVYGAGQVGCGPREVRTALVAQIDSTPEFNLTVPVEGYDGRGGGTWVPTLNGLPRAVANRAHVAANEIDTTVIADGTDVLVTRQARSPGVRVAESIAFNESPLIYNTANSGIAAGDVVVIADCEKASVFKVDALTDEGGDIRLTTSTGTGLYQNRSPFELADNGSYGNAAIVAPIDTTFFFIAPGTGTNNRGDAPLSLWRKLGDGPPVEMIEGIEDLQVLFGLDTNRSDGFSGVNRYVTADLVNDPEQVYSIRVTITANSVNAVTNNDGDGLLRRSFTQTFLLRNARPI